MYLETPELVISEETQSEYRKNREGILCKLRASARSKIAFLIGAVLTAVYPTSGLAESEYGYGQNCTLFTLPYNPDANDILDNSDSPYINFLSSDECDQHLTYPNQYSPQPPIALENPVNSGSEKKKLSVATHEHAYVNDSDYNNPPKTYYYKSFIDRFEITIQPDGFLNLYANSITCNYIGSNADLADCDGYAPDLYGGTKVTKVSNSQNKTITITWDFAQNVTYNNGGRPSRYGNNGQNFVSYDQNGTPSFIDLTKPENRKMEFHVNLPTKDNGEIWSATTTARVLLANQAILQRNYSLNHDKGCTLPGGFSNNENGWCYISPPAGYETEVVQTPSGSYTFYWYPIGSVATVWRKPPPSYDDNPPDVLPNDIDRLYADIDDAIDRKDYNRAAGILDKLLAIKSGLGGNIFEIAAWIYDETQQYDKEERACDRGTKELDSTRERSEYIKLLQMCAERLISSNMDDSSKGNSGKGLQYLLLKYNILTGLTDKQAVLNKIAFNENDARLSVVALGNMGKYEEASSLLLFYYQTNSALLKSDDCYTLAKWLGIEHHAAAALGYYYDRKIEASQAKKWGKIIDDIVIPAAIIGGAIYTATQQQAQREAEERKKAEEEARRKQAARDAENAKRRAQGLPTLEEEEQRRWQEQQEVRDRISARCLEVCETNYHSCIGNSDPKCCTDFCLVVNCPSICSSILASCRRDCD